MPTKSKLKKDDFVYLMILLMIGFVIWNTESYNAERNQQRDPASRETPLEPLNNDTEDSIDGSDVSFKPSGGTNMDVDPTIFHASGVKDSDHNHEDCKKAVEWALKNGAMDEDIPEMTEQEKFNFLLENPKVEAALEYYEEYMVDENGQEVRRQDLEEAFEMELEQLHAQGGAVADFELGD